MHLAPHGWEVYIYIHIHTHYIAKMFDDEFLAQGLHLKSHQRCSAAFCRPVKFHSGNIELRCPALNHMFNQSKLTARRQVR